MGSPRLLAAHRALGALLALRPLAFEFWDLVDKGYWDRDNCGQEEYAQFVNLRTGVDEAVARVGIYANDAGVDIMAEAHPPAPYAGRLPVERFNLFEAITDPKIGYGDVGDGGGDRPTMIRQQMTRLEVHLREIRRRAFLRLVIPLYWLVDIPALVVRFPFMVLRAAGLPPKVEENILSQVLKGVLSVVLSVALTVLLAYLGLERFVPDLAKTLFGK